MPAVLPSDLRLFSKLACDSFDLVPSSLTELINAWYCSWAAFTPSAFSYPPFILTNSSYHVPVSSLKLPSFIPALVNSLYCLVLNEPPCAIN